jgi:hypothetical protein
MCSTINHLFSGSSQLFDGLWDFEKEDCPVIQAENHGVEISEEDIYNSMIFESLIYDISKLK